GPREVDRQGQGVRLAVAGYVGADRVVRVQPQQRVAQVRGDQGAVVERGVGRVDRIRLAIWQIPGEAGEIALGRTVGTHHQIRGRGGRRGRAGGRGAGGGEGH